MLTCAFLGLLASATTPPTIDGEYRLQWDDKIDGQIDGFDKVCEVRIHVRRGRVTGDFVGPIAGEPRKAKIEGRIEGSDGPNLLTFRQVERGYVCAYQMTVGAGSFIGVWHDTKGRSGDFMLLKYRHPLVRSLT